MLADVGSGRGCGSSGRRPASSSAAVAGEPWRRLERMRMDRIRRCGPSTVGPEVITFPGPRPKVSLFISNFAHFSTKCFFSSLCQIVEETTSRPTPASPSTLIIAAIHLDDPSTGTGKIVISLNPWPTLMSHHPRHSRPLMTQMGCGHCGPFT